MKIALADSVYKKEKKMSEYHHVIKTHQLVDGELETNEINVESYDRAVFLIESMEMFNFNKIELYNHQGDLVHSVSKPEDKEEPIDA
jgi:hypothetical protein